MHKKYSVARLGASGDIHIEEGDVQRVCPSRDGKHDIDVYVKGRSEYQGEPGYEWLPGSQHLRVRLVARQALEIVNQDRAEDAKAKTFCENCFDHGKSSDPESCVRCQLLKAMMDAGQGDHRRQRTPIAHGPGWGMAAALGLMILVWWWTLCQWTGAAQERDAARHELQRIRITRKIP